MKVYVKITKHEETFVDVAETAQELMEYNSSYTYHEDEDMYYSTDYFITGYDI